MNSLFNPYSIDVLLEDESTSTESQSTDGNLEDCDEVISNDGCNKENKRGIGKNYEFYKTYPSFKEAKDALENDPLLALDSNWVKGMVFFSL
jgi:hypothetical protein